MKIKLCITCCLFLAFALKGYAAIEPDSVKKEKKLTLTPFPAVFITPETGFGYGLLGVAVYNFGEDTLTRDSNLQGLGYLTTKKQSSLQLSYLIFTNREDFILSGDNNFFDFSIFYYGVGNNTPNSDESLINYKYVTLQNRALKQVKGHFYTGAQLQVNRMWEVEYGLLENKSDSSKLAQRPREELGTTTVSGFGPVVVYDKRDNPLNTITGMYLELGTHINHSMFGSDFNFTRVIADFRKFVPLRTDHVIAFQGRGIFNSGDAPFRELANLGGKMISRGYYEGRFRDKHMAAVQAEYRWHAFKRIGFVVFGSAGQVADKFTSFGVGQSKLAGGGGIRLMINRKQKLNVRIDYAIGKGDASGLYFALGEAF